MKKWLIMIVFILLLTLSGCDWIPSYEATFNDFEQHLEDNRETYLERIELINSITDEAMRGIVKIKKSSSTMLSNAFGSGLIFDEDLLYYYVLTNNHIIYDTDMDHAKIQVYDYKNNVYNATYIASSSMYDLAILRINKKQDVLHIFTFAQDNPEIGERMITLGYPESQLNTINMGNLEQYGQVTIDVDDMIINVDFDVIYAEIPVKSGSSGSATVNSQLELIGIVFAGNFQENASVADYAFIIPIDQIKTFLTAQEMEYHEVTS